MRYYRTLLDLDHGGRRLAMYDVGLLMFRPREPIGPDELGRVIVQHCLEVMEDVSVNPDLEAEEISLAVNDTWALSLTSQHIVDIWLGLGVTPGASSALHAYAVADEVLDLVEVIRPMRAWPATAR